MFRKLHPGLAASQREDLFLEYSFPPRTRDFALGLRARVSALSLPARVGWGHPLTCSSGHLEPVLVWASKGSVSLFHFWKDVLV